MNTDERKFWMDVYVACVRSGNSYDAKTQADNAVQRYRKSNVELQQT